MKRRPDIDDVEFDRAWSTQLVPAIQAALEKQGTVRQLVLCLGPSALNAPAAQAFPRQFDGMLAIWFDQAHDATAAFAELALNESLYEIAAQIVSPDDGVAFVAKAVPPVLDGKANLTFTAGTDTAKHLSLQQAQDYFLNVHPRVAQFVPEVWKFLARFAQFCGDPATVLETDHWLAKHRFIPLAFDVGVADEDDFIGMYSHPVYLGVIRPDEQTFSDGTNMVGYLTGREIVLLDR